MPIQSVQVAIWLSDAKYLGPLTVLKIFLVNCLNILTSYNYKVPRESREKGKYHKE